MKLQTPLGEIQILLDGIPYPCEVEEITSRPCFCSDVQHIYRLRVKFIPDQIEHEIACVLPQLSAQKVEICSEPGDKLECFSAWTKTAKVSLAIESDAGYFNEKRHTDYDYDYDGTVLKNGIAYVILSQTKTEDYVFGLSWIDPVNEQNDHQTWFAADPTIL